MVYAPALAGGVALGSAGCPGGAEAAVSGDDTPPPRAVQAVAEPEDPGIRAPGEQKEGIMHPNERIGEAEQAWWGWGGRVNPWWGWGGGFYNPWWGWGGRVSPWWGWGGGFYPWYGGYWGW